ncbi:Protein of unknown function [Bacillus thuringiensis]|uniref:Uncharacterized protein n=1 Tax=Bacillus thuringiensis TaxID=1428 RepID=A0A1C4CVF7_BACTU|nr:Protein of unknown function [Bacillus thuringiensis]
MADKNIGD